MYNRYIRKGVQEIVFFIFLTLCTSILFISFGFSDPIPLFLLGVASFGVTSALRNLVWRRYVIHTNIQPRKHILIECMVFILLFQSLLVLFVPLSSVVPGRLLESLHILTYIEGDVCARDAYFENAREFWGNTINFEDVHIVAGGEMYVMQALVNRGMLSGDTTYLRSAVTFGDTIYTSSIDECMTLPIFFHEMTHVWQMQTQRKTLWGITTVPDWISYVYTQFTNPDILYDYGGGNGLMQAEAEGKSFFDYGIEQQAMIIGDLMWFRIGYVLPEGKEYSKRYQAVLEQYATEMLKGNRTTQ